MLQQLNRYLEKMMPAITPVSVVIGVSLASDLAVYSYAVPWIFALMTFSGSLSSNFKSLHRAVTHPLPMLTALFILHLLMPAWAWAVGHLTFGSDSLTITGLILAVTIPTGITSFVWVSIYRGNLGLTLSIILIDTFLSPFLVPYCLSLFAGEKVVMDTWGMMKGLFGMVVIPSLIGMLLHEMTKGKIQETLGTKLAPFSKLAMAAVVMMNSAVVAPYLQHINGKLIFTALVVLFISATGYVCSWFAGTLLKWNREDQAALLFTGGMRNISAGAVLATTYFPAPVAVPVVIGMLFQQVLASLFGYMLQKSHEKKEYSGQAVKSNG